MSREASSKPAAPELPARLGTHVSVASVLPGIGLCAAAPARRSPARRWRPRRWRSGRWRSGSPVPYIEALVLAILIGIAVRTAWVPDARFRTGIAFTAEQLLEVAVVLLGAAPSLGAILASGRALLVGIIGTVALAIAAGIAICRALGLPPRMAILVACGNAICGHSAIAAVAPVIQPEPGDIAASIAFTAVL